MKFGGEELDQIEYVWMQPDYASGADQGANRCEHYLGVRITLDHDGYPLIWEALHSGEGPHLVFVAESLEAEAKALFGEPQRETHFALMRTDSPEGHAVIVAAVEQGPVPMGPYVYVSKRPAPGIVNVLCRCSPSLVDEFVAAEWYELKPVEAIEDRCPALFRQLGATPPLGKVIRWPRKH